MTRAKVVSLFIGFTAVTVSAQERVPAGPPPNGPTFDVVSIKRVTDIRDRRSIGEQPGGRFVVSGMAIAPVIRSAYPADIADLIGAPDWVMSEVYDLTAQAGRDVSREQMEAMLRAMLADRFKLAVHYETQERPVYAMVLLGGRPLSALAGSFGPGLGRVVVDKTGLTGNYEVKLNYMPQPKPDAPPDAPPNVFTALQEQLGLKLEPDRAPLKTLVIDRIERPAEN